MLVEQISGLSIFDVIALSGGLLVVIYLILESIVGPLGRHLYMMELIESFFFVGGESISSSNLEGDQSHQNINLLTMENTISFNNT